MLAVALALAFALAEFVVIARLELSFDEAYYVLWSRHLAFGYLDHPPMVAVWIRLSTLVFGSAEFGVRALNVVAFALTPAMLGFAAARLFDSLELAPLRRSAWFATPLIAGGFLATPDTPLIFFSIVALIGLVEAGRGRAWGWAIVGVALGLALQSKFSALFLFAGLALALLVAPSLSRWRFSPAPYLALIIAAAIFAPFVYWNAAHGWETFAKQFSRVPADHLGLRYIPDFLAAQIGLANPLFVVAVAGWLFQTRRKAGAALSSDGEARRILLAFLAPALAYFLIHALHERVQANWTGPVFPHSRCWRAPRRARPVWVRRTAGAGVALGSAVIAVALLHAATFWPSFGAGSVGAHWRLAELVAEVDARARLENSAFRHRARLRLDGSPSRLRRRSEAGDAGGGARTLGVFAAARHDGVRSPGSGVQRRRPRF